MSYDYYKIEAASASGLKALDKQVRGKPPLIVTPAMEQGRALHEALLEPHKAEKWALEHPLVKQYQESPLFKMLLINQKARKEYACFRKMRFIYNGVDVSVPTKSLADFYMPEQKAIYDFKFMSSKVTYPLPTIEFLGYDIQASLYLDMFRASTFTFLFDPSTFFTIRKGDDVYNNGRKKYMELMWQYYILKTQ